MNEHAGIYAKSKEYAGPVLHAYVSWVLEEAGRRDIQTLYFLARDGYVLCKIAQLICEAQGLDITCRYLYCSRASLRVPAYHLIGEEAYDLIFLGGYHVTVKSFFERAGIPKGEWEQIMAEAGITLNPAQELGYSQITACREKLVSSPAFRESMRKNSKKSYQAALGYLSQEGLAGQPKTAIVDSGWTGSMQRSLRQLLDSAGYEGYITGFYFGLFQTPGDIQDGEYLSWYFTPYGCRKNKILFCNNLLECFLSAPHGMTTGYELQRGRYIPVLKNTDDMPLGIIHEQVRGILDGAREQMARGTPLAKNQCERILHRLMARPAPEEVELYGRFMFCDDITESYRHPLADSSQISYLRDTLLPVRIIKKITGRSGKRGIRQPFWSYGTIALVKNPVMRNLYWLNEYMCQWYRMTLR